MDFLIFCLLAAGISGGFINGLAGFGTGLFALGWLLQVLTPAEAVAIVVCTSVLISGPGLWKIRQHIRLPRLMRLLVPAFIGMPFGFAVLQWVDVRILSVIVAVLMLVYGGYFGLRRNLPQITGDWHLVEAIIGFFGGLLGAMAGLSGAFPSMWFALRPWPKGEQRAAMQPFSAVILLLTMLLLWVDGAYTPQVLQGLIFALPASFLGSAIGLWCFGKIPDALFSRLLIGLMLLSGFVLLLRTMTV